MENQALSRAPLFCSLRLIIALVASIGFILVYAQRVGMSVAIVCMVNHTALSSAHFETYNLSQYNYTEDVVSALRNGTKENECNSVVERPADSREDGPFLWEKETQGHILSAFFYGYLVSQVPGGVLSERFGSRKVLSVFIGLSSLATLLCPLAAQWGYPALIAMRIMVGIGSGAIFPAINALWSQWAPPLERTKLAGISYTGAMFGNVFAFPVAGGLCQGDFLGGWPSVFYVFGGLSVVWLFVWFAAVSDKPATHRCITNREKNYITTSLKGQQLQERKPRVGEIPWCKFMTSLPVWAIVVANVTTDWGLAMFLTNIPSYMHEVLKFDIQSNGLLSALPFIGLTLMMVICPPIADKLRASGAMSTTLVRKIFQCIGAFGAAGFMVGLAFTDCTKPYVAIICLTLGVTLTGCTYSAFLVNHMDLAPRYAGTLFGISNGIAAIPGFLAPYVTSVLTKNKTVAEWQRVFFIAAGVYAFGAVVYAVFASGELQSWASTSDEKPGRISNGHVSRDDVDDGALLDEQRRV